MNDELESLIARYLDGNISAEEVRRLDERVKTDAEARRELHRAACREAEMSRAFAADQPTPAERRAPQMALARWALAAAALLAVVVAGWLYFGTRPQAYPSPRAEGDVRILRDGTAPAAAAPVARGDRVVAGKDGGRLLIGGYCSLDLFPGTELVVRGEPRREAVELQNGCLASRVERGKGEFRVVTSLGSVKVIGTEFLTSVERLDFNPTGENAMTSRPLAVTVMVMAGVVSASFGAEAESLGAGESRTFFAAGGAVEQVAAPAPAPAARAVDVDLTRPSVITLDVTDAKLADVLAEIARQSGNKPFAVGGDVAPKPVTLRVDKQPYWEAVDRLCEQQGLLYQSNPQAEELQLVPAPADARPAVTQYAGPLVFKLASVAVERDFNNPAPDRVKCTVDLFWEDRLGLSVFTPVVIEKVTDADGKDCGVQRGVETKMGKMTSSGGGGGRRLELPANTCWGSFAFTLPNPANRRGALQEVSGQLSFVRKAGQIEMRIENALGGGEPSVEQDGYKLTVTRAERKDAVATVTVALEKDGRRVAFDWPARGGWSLVDAAGNVAEGLMVGGMVHFQNLPEDDRGALTLVRKFSPDVAEVTYRIRMKQVPLP